MDLKNEVCGMVRSRGSKSLFLREGLILFLQSLNERIPQLAQGETFVPAHAIRIEPNLCCFPDDEFCMSTFFGQDTDVMKLEAVTQVYAELGHR
jgi:hypothetical protein